ncbi:peptidase [Oscillatoriales cyanobacterium LEGE 11467]|uniref:Peptidase n=1 Tax=Zarconia navalis LEGE 11467 TaxID=1828826 RepID=A0A928W189_9CYAN|nr:peptidase [Zarconia navalis]MBE9041415.1 peptidase [Zarconia navalis LEGE 11467]
MALSILLGGNFSRSVAREGFVNNDRPSVRDLQPEELLEIVPLQAHPLPPALTERSDTSGSGDYFDRIESTSVGALVWSEFPVKVYIASDVTATGDRLTASSPSWDRTVAEAVSEWIAYFPLEIVDRRELADITIERKRPPPQRLPNGDIRARSALTQYQLYARPDGENARAMLCHRFEVTINPTQSGDYLRAAVRHELGHALGIWGHSPSETDALYFSQTQTPAVISDGDLNTLKRIYEQPTRLGWWVAIEF